MFDPTAPRYDAPYLAWNTVAGFDTFEGAQAAVARLADAGFAVQHLDIVGTDVRLVDRVTGRITRGRAAAAGAARGVWTGLFVGLMLSLFVSGANFATVMLVGMLVGVGTGAALGVAAQTATRGKREFATLRTMVAGRYDLIARDGSAEQARSILQPGGYVTV